MQADTGLFTFGEQQLKDVAGFVIAEQLAELFLVVRHAMLGHQCDEIPLGITRQRGFAEVRVLRQEGLRLRVYIGKVAAVFSSI